MTQQEDDETQSKEDVPKSVTPVCARNFVPVTKETIEDAITIMHKYSIEDRLVVIVFDSCFLLPNLTLRQIQAKFSKLFGNIGHHQVMIKSNMPRLMNNLDEACKHGFSSQNQAYIICDMGVVPKELNRRSEAYNVLCCPMTMGCVINNLQRGAFLMSPGAFTTDMFTSIAKPEPQVKLPSDQPSKKSRMAASLGSSDTMDAQTPSRSSSSASDPVKEPRDYCARIKIRPFRRRFNTPIWVGLVRSGNVVIAIDNLPGDLTLDAFNLMMGTYTLKSEQVVGITTTLDNGEKEMDVRVTIRSNNSEIAKLISKNNCKTAQGNTLKVYKTTFAELKKFMTNTPGDFALLNVADTLPKNKVAYSDRH